MLASGKDDEFSEYVDFAVNEAGSPSKQRCSCVSGQSGKCLNPGLKGEAGLSSASLKTDKLDADS